MRNSGEMNKIVQRLSLEDGTCSMMHANFTVGYQRWPINSNANIPCNKPTHICEKSVQGGGDFLKVRCMERML